MELDKETFTVDIILDDIEDAASMAAFRFAIFKNGVLYEEIENPTMTLQDVGERMLEIYKEELEEQLGVKQIELGALENEVKELREAIELLEKKPEVTPETSDTPEISDTPKPSRKVSFKRRGKRAERADNV
jgi:ribosome biogenesis GTPase A